jgi:molybdenum cofactor cytidylyltransferase
LSTAGLVLAAGEGRRFGGPKQLAQVGGAPILERVVAAMRAVPALERIVVVLGARADEIRAGVEFGAAEVVVAEGWAEGQAASLRAGVAALAAFDAILVCLGDQPFITPQVVAGTLEHDADAPAVRAAYNGIPGHPVLLREPVLREIPALRGDVGARDLLGRFDVSIWEAGLLGDPTDIDTREQLEAVTR